MLKSLSVKNYALITDLVIDLNPGLNIFTGETGAGKSILLGALGSLLGDRMDISVLRDGAKKTVVEGTFRVDQDHPVNTFLADESLDAEDTDILLRRELYDTGRTRAFVNDVPVQLATFQVVGDFLVDFHGQHAHQSLLKEKNHLGFLDEFGAFEQDLARVRLLHEELVASLDQLRELEAQQATLSELNEQYRFQIEEIDRVNPESDEDISLAREETLITQGERLFSLGNQCYSVLYDAEGSVFEQLTQVRNWLTELTGIDAELKTHLSDFDSARLIIEELAKQIVSYSARIDFNPEHLEETQERLATLSGLKKKYGPTLQEVLDLRERLARKLESHNRLEAEITNLTTSVKGQRERFSEACRGLSMKRSEAAKEVEEKLPNVLKYLGMPGSRFKVALEYQSDPNGNAIVDGQSYRATALGMDFAKFIISTNPGMDFRPLAKTASGGEISRVMLALKSLLVSRGQVPVLVFDEIDSGVSGRIANAVGKKVQELSRIHQVLCITHLPQIASMADTHYVVEKKQSGNQVNTWTRQLSSEERTEAIAKLIAGETVSETHLRSARELLQDAIA